MTTQSTVYPEVNVATARKNSSEDRSVSEMVDAAAPEVKAKLRRMLESGKARVGEWKGGFEDGIREKPVQSVLIAAGVGAVVGLLVGRYTR
jgi:ElaB/YqjD/DUF883 family membrane-anchored ribosome-binding protein